MPDFRNLKTRQSHSIVAVVLFIVICSLSFIWELLFDIWDFRLVRVRIRDIIAHDLLILVRFHSLFVSESYCVCAVVFVYRNRVNSGVKMKRP